MKRYGFLAAFIITVFLLGCSTLVYGAGENSLSIPLMISWGDGGLQPEKTYQLTLEGMKSGEPLPEEAVDRYNMKLESDKKISALPEIIYENPGEYIYILKLTRADGMEIGTYYLRVTAAYGEGENLQITYSLHKNSANGIKTDKLLFQDPKTSDTVTPESSGTSEITGVPVVTEASGSTKAGKVKTGDETRILFYILTGCTALLCILAAEKRKHKL